MAHSIQPGKRQRPSYVHQFPPLDEFSESSDSSASSSRSNSTNPPSLIITFKAKSPEGRKKLAEIQRADTSDGRQPTSLQTSEQEHHNTKRLLLNFQGRADDVIRIQTSPQSPTFPPIISTIRKQQHLPIERHNIPSQGELLGNAQISEHDPDRHSRARTSRRCQRCTQHKKGCDGAIPVCGYCSKMKGDTLCVYDEPQGLSGDDLVVLTSQQAESFMDVEDYAEMARNQANWVTTKHFARTLSRRQLALEVEYEELKPGEWSYGHHDRLLKYIDCGIRPPSDGGTFDETTRMLEDSQQQEGSLADDWAREQYAGLDIR